MTENPKVNPNKKVNAKAPRLVRKVGIAERVLKFLAQVLPSFIVSFFIRLDKRVDGALGFFFKHYGKSKFMIAMSKKAQVLGIEKLWIKGPKAFIYFFLFYLVRDTILYIIIPIYFARMTTGN